MPNDGSITFGTEVDESGLKKALGNIGSLAGKGLAAVGTATAGALAATTTGLVTLGKQSIETTQQFDSSMSQIAATLGLTSKEIENNIDGAGDTFDALRAKALQMGSETNFTAQQAADGLNILAMSGYDAESSIAMIEDVLHLAAAGSMDLATASGYVSGAMKGFADSTKDAAYYADLMAKGATLANTSVPQLGDALSGAAAVAASYGQSADSVTISLLRLAEQGVVGSAASTELAAAMKNLYAPTQQAADALKEVGVSAFDENGNFRDFNTVVNELYDSLNALGDDGLPKYTDAQKTAIAQTIFGIQGFNAYNQMVVTSTAKQEKWAKALADSSGEASKQYATMTDNLQGDLDILGSAFDGLKIAIGDELMPTVRDFVQFGSGALASLTEAFNVGGIEGAFAELGTILSDGLVMLLDYLPTAIEIGGQLLSSVLTGLSSHGEEIVAAALEAVSQLATAILQNAPLVLQTGISLLGNLISGIAGQLPTLIPLALDVVLQLVNSLLDNTDTVIDAGLNLLFALVDGVLAATPKLLEAAPTIITKLVNAIISNLPKLVQAALQLMIALNRGLLENTPLLLKSSIILIGELIRGLISMVPALVDAMFDLGKEAAEAFKDTDWLAIGKNVIQGIIDGVVSMLSRLWSTMSNVASGLLSRAKNALGIHSPSTKFRDQIGKQSARGIAVGFDEEIGNAYDNIQAAIDSEQKKLEVSENVQMATAHAEGIDGKTPEYVETVINIDGKETARVLSPYVTKEIAWETK